MYKVGLSSCAKNLLENGENLFASYEKAGIAAMEIAVPAGQHLLLDYKKVQVLAKQHNVKLWSYHLPYYPFNEVDIADEKISKKAVGYFSELIKRAAEIGIDKFIVHPSGILDNENEREEKKKVVKESLFVLADVAEKNGAVIAVENMIPGCIGRNSSEMLELLEVSPKLRSCFDTNHLLGENPLDYIRAIGSRIVTVHVSDYDFINERHWLPGEGKNDWNGILKALSDIGYDRIWMYEIDFECPDTIVRDRDLTCEDFVRNARELFSGEALTVIGRAK